MANALYPKWKQSLLTQADTYNSLDTSSTYPLKAALFSKATHAYSAADDMWDDVSSGVIGTPQTIGTRTVTSGVFNGDDVTFTAVTSAIGDVDSIILFIDTGTPSTSRLVAFLDTSVTGIPVTPNGGNITITWDTSIFTL